MPFRVLGPLPANRTMGAWVLSCRTSHPDDKGKHKHLQSVSMCPELCWKHYNHHLITVITYEVGTVLIFTLRMGKLRQRKARGFFKATQGVCVKARTRSHCNEGEVL